MEWQRRSVSKGILQSMRSDILMVGEFAGCLLQGGAVWDAAGSEAQ